MGAQTIRELFVYSWRVIYRVQPGVVTILTIVHQTQDFQAETGRF